METKKIIFTFVVKIKWVKKEMSFYNPGDFSFLKEHSFIFEYDYKIINKLGDIAWNSLKSEKEDTIFNIIVEQLYPGHTGLTYRKSINYLKYIAVYGWDSFVLHVSGKVK